MVDSIKNVDVSALDMLRNLRGIRDEDPKLGTWRYVRGRGGKRADWLVGVRG